MANPGNDNETNNPDDKSQGRSSGIGRFCQGRLHVFLHAVIEVDEPDRRKIEPLSSKVGNSDIARGRRSSFSTRRR